MEDMEKIKLYARVNDNNDVIRLLNTIFDCSEITNSDILIGEGYGDDYAHPQVNYEIMDIDGNYNYKLANGKIIKKTLAIFE